LGYSPSNWINQKKRKASEVIAEKIPGINRSLLAQLFQLSRRILYKRQADASAKDALLKEQILDVLTLHPAYGHRRVALELSLGKKRIRRVMKQYGIKPYKRQGRWRKRRDEQRAPQPYQNCIKGSCPIQAGTVLVGDFTHLRYQSKFLYLATYMDLCTREIVGWYVSARHTKEIVLEALLDAIKTLGHTPKTVHTDQGSEYCSKEYTDFLTSLNITISMSKKASPWENGYQESFYNNFKTDLGLEFDRFNTMGELIEGIHQTIRYYNKQRIHTSLKMSPEQFKLRKQKY
jgi:transposase InsO family protein